MWAIAKVDEGQTLVVSGITRKEWHLGPGRYRTGSTATGWNWRLGESVARGGGHLKQRGWVSEGPRQECAGHPQKEHARVCLGCRVSVRQAQSEGKERQGPEAQGAVIQRGTGSCCWATGDWATQTHSNSLLAAQNPPERQKCIHSLFSVGCLVCTTGCQYVPSPLDSWRD